MDLIALIVTLAVIGGLLWLLNTYGSPYIDGKILHIINIVAVIAIILWLLKIFGILGYASGIRVGP